MVTNDHPGELASPHPVLLQLTDHQYEITLANLSFPTFKKQVTDSNREIPEDSLEWNRVNKKGKLPVWHTSQPSHSYVADMNVF